MTASVLPRIRDRVKDVPWMAVAVEVGLSVVGDKISESIKCMGTGSVFDKSTDTILEDVSYVASRKRGAEGRISLMQALAVGHTCLAICNSCITSATQQEGILHNISYTTLT